MIRTFLYDAQGHDEEVTLNDDLPELAEHQLLWIDASGRDSADLQKLTSLLDLKAQSVRDLGVGGRSFTLANYGDYVHFDVAAIDADRTPAAPSKLPRTIRLDVVIGPGWLLTAHEQPLRFLEDFRDQDRGETLIGSLTAAALTASLLDWHLAAYLAALAEVETLADRLDVRMLSTRSVRDNLLQELVGARLYLSSLRRSLSPQSAVFYGLSRPDIVLISDENGVAAFERLERRYERVLDSIEHGRELVQSSFDLFTTRTAETTNNLIRRLTFLSILLGALCGVTGIFGMNFETPYQRAGVVGFWLVVGGFLVLGTLSAVIARWRRWI
jgi:magnesium transporter